MHFLRKLGVIQFAHHLLVTKHLLDIKRRNDSHLQRVHISGIAVDANELLEIRMELLIRTQALCIHEFEEILV